MRNKKLKNNKFLELILLLFLMVSLTIPSVSAAGVRVLSETKIPINSPGFNAALGLSSRFGTSIAELGDLNGDLIPDIAVSANIPDTIPTGSGGEIWVLFMNEDGTVNAQQRIAEFEGGFNGEISSLDAFAPLANIGDLDGDGVVDLAVGAPGDDPTAQFSSRGAVYILFMNPNGTVKNQQKISQTDGGLGAILNDTAKFGSAVTGMGDVDGDGILDIAVGAPYESQSTFRANVGAMYILFLNTDGTVKASQKISQFDGGGFSLPSAWTRNHFFASALTGVGDLNSDGIPDVAVGQPRFGALRRRTTGNPGAVWILFLNADGTIQSFQQHFRIIPGGIGRGFGTALANMGDLYGNGDTVLAATDPGYIGNQAPFPPRGSIGSGAVQLMSLNSDGTLKSLQTISGLEGNFRGNIGAGFGRSLANIGDIDNNGFTDLAIGSPYDTNDNTRLRGAVWTTFLEDDANPLPVSSSDLDVSVIGTPDTVNAGAIISYAVTVVNHGPDRATGINLNSDLPGGRATGSNVSCSSRTPFFNITECPLEHLESGESVALTIEYDAPGQNGPATNIVTVTANEEDSIPANNQASATSMVIGGGNPLLPDLLGNITKLKAKIKNGKTKLKFNVKVQNDGSNSATGFVNKAYVSTDDVLDINTDTLIATWNVNSLAIGGSDRFKSKSKEPGDLSDQFLIIQIDAADANAEADETNNLIIQQIP